MNKKGFTFIELIVVIAVLGILVLLASSKFIGYAEKARVTQIKNDIVVHENYIESKRFDDNDYHKRWELVSQDDFLAKKEAKEVYSKRGLIVKEEQINKIEKTLYLIEKRLVNTHLEGDFIYSEDGTVYYVEDIETTGSKEESDGNNVPFTPEDDFEWVEMGTPASRSIQTSEYGYWRYIGDDSVVNIPHTIGGKPVTTYENMFEPTDTDDRSGIKKIISTNPNLQDVTRMFNEAIIDGIDFSEFDTSTLTSLDQMFARAHIVNLDLSKLNIETIEDLGSLFSYSTVENLNLKGLDISNLTSLNYLFSDVTGTNALDVSGLDTSNVTKLNGTFADADFPAIVGLETWDISQVEEMFATFYGLDISRVQDIERLDVSNVYDFGKVFADTIMEDIDLTHWDLSSAENLNSMFSGAQMNNVDFNNWEFPNVYETDWMFEGAKLSNISFEGWDVSNIESMVYMFQSSELSNVSFEEWDTSSVESMRYMFENAKTETLDISSFTINQADVYRMFRNAQIGTVIMKDSTQKSWAEGSGSVPGGIIFTAEN